MSGKSKTIAIITPILFSLTLIIGILIGNSYSKLSDKSLTLYPNTDKLNAVLSYIEEEYVDTISREELIEEAIPEILKKLDPHSIYIPKQDMSEMNEPLEGNFDGIGIQFNIQNDTIMVVNTIKGGPSERMGIMAGDRIVEVNDKNVAGIKIKSDDVVKKLKGPSGSKVKVGISRKGVKKVLNFNIVRDKIPLESIDIAYMLTKDIGYIKINKFARTTYDEFIKAVADLKAKGMKKIVVDLRGNSGGYMDAATNIIDEFLEKGKLIVYTQGRSRPINKTLASSRGALVNDNVAILIDEWSASASEIMAGAIQDNDRGVIIGRRSFGKGLVQEPTYFSDGSGLRLTIARYYTPTGRCIQKSYKDGYDSYYQDIGSRYMNGEFSDTDSIDFPDSLKFYTKEGKVVYGGGGIMPDYFIPVDTQGVTFYLTDVVNHGYIYSYAFKYTDENREILNKFKTYQQLDNYLDKQDLLNDFVEYAEKNGIKRNDEEIAKSKKILLTHLKAFIIRNIFDDEGFYPIIHRTDKTIKKAIEVLNNKN